ncbi:EI24 domain-containing protein [Sphingobium aromaticiconvertens]|uniref:EI24 domain-containing protein n=1 Tax=Sphingobium aromaticiconvertens TaxID=365341 RepID=UPI003017501F
MILAALFRSLPQIFHPAARAVLGRTLLVTLLVFAILGAALWWGIDALLDWRGWDGGLAEGAASGLVTLVAAWFLFRAIAMAVMGLFADAIIEAVEKESYPQAAIRARPVGFTRSLCFALASLTRTLGLNLLALPLYIVLLVTGVGTLVLFLVLNAWLLGRDMADMVEPRHPDLPPIARAGRWLMGLVSALLFLLPVVNLLAPIWSAAMAVHMLHNRKRIAA